MEHIWMSARWCAVKDKKKQREDKKKQGEDKSAFTE